MYNFEKLFILIAKYFIFLIFELDFYIIFRRIAS